MLATVSQHTELILSSAESCHQVRQFLQRGELVCARLQYWGRPGGGEQRLGLEHGLRLDAHDACPHSVGEGTRS